MYLTPHAPSSYGGVFVRNTWCINFVASSPAVRQLFLFVGGRNSFLTILRPGVSFFLASSRASGALASPGAAQAPASVSALAPADLKQLSTAAPLDAALTTSRGGARAAPAPKPKGQTLLVGIYFFLW